MSDLFTGTEEATGRVSSPSAGLSDHGPAWAFRHSVLAAGAFALVYFLTYPLRLWFLTDWLPFDVATTAFGLYQSVMVMAAVSFVLFEIIRLTRTQGWL